MPIPNKISNWPQLCNEIDAVIQSDDGRWGCLEIKPGMSVVAGMNFFIIFEKNYMGKNEIDVKERSFRDDEVGKDIERELDVEEQERKKEEELMKMCIITNMMTQ